MTCYSPLNGYRSRIVGHSGKRGIVFNKNQGYVDLPVKVPCGQCIGCRLDRSRQWAIRCLHEASLYNSNCFITLTYADEYIPYKNSLDKRAFQLFMKRLRKKYGNKIRYYQCGEYGEITQRPHYHAIIFNFDFPDKKLHKIQNKHRLYTSASLEELWPYGYSLIGNVSFQSAAYVARYIMKKVTGPAAELHYGERIPEYTTMSRRPGIGKAWFDKYKDDVYPTGAIVINGKEIKPPKYYDRQYEIIEEVEYSRIKSKRKIEAKKQEKNNTLARLKVRETVQQAKLNLLKRTL
jgi:hypothetical protein